VLASLASLASIALLSATLGAQTPAPPRTAVATFAAGCFWCAEADFEKVPGVVDAVSGYTGGRVANPTYEQVSGGGTGHREVVRVTYDPARVSYARLLDVFWRAVDPWDADGQFCDKGPQYTAAVYAHDAEQRRQAEASKRALRPAGGRPGQPIVTAIVDAGPFYAAEAYHQAYAARNPLRYRFYRTTCGRDDRLREVWGDAATH
jgi:peptide-methionine (S)-S-oxide reductase